jgi:hypothetical protein
MNHYTILRTYIYKHYRDFCMTSNLEYSTENDWNQLIKKAKYHNKSLLAIKLLNLNERKWNKENILLSDVKYLK